MEININEHNNNDDACMNNAKAIDIRDTYAKAIMAIRTACISPAINDKKSRILDVLRGLDMYADYLPNATVLTDNKYILSSLDAVEDINVSHLKYLNAERLKAISFLDAVDDINATHLKAVGNSHAVCNTPDDTPTDKDIEVARQCIDRLVNARSTSELTMDEIVNLDKLFYHAYPERLINGK